MIGFAGCAQQVKLHVEKIADPPLLFVSFSFFFSFLYFFIPFRPCLRVLGGEKNLRVQHVAMMRSQSYTAIQPIFDRPESENFENFFFFLRKFMIL